MGMIRDIVTTIRVGKALFHDKVRDLQAGKAVEISQQDIDDAQHELGELQTKVGAFDGYVAGLEQEVDRLVDEKAHLVAERDEYVNMIRLAGQAESPDQAQIEQYRRVAKNTIAELDRVNARLEAANSELDTARQEYEELMDTIKEIGDFIEAASDDLDADRRALDKAELQRSAADMNRKLSTPGTDSAISRLKDSTAERKKLVNERIGQARTARRLAADPERDLRQRVQAQIADKRHEEALDALLAGQAK